MNTGDEFNNIRKKRCAEGMIIQIENLFNYLSENNSYFIKKYRTIYYQKTNIAALVYSRIPHALAYI